DINLNNSDLLYSAYKNTSKYLDTKVWYEEGHDGSGYAQWATSSLLNQKNEYIKFIRKIANGFVPIVKASLSENDKILNKRYKKIKERLKKTPVRGMRMSIMEKDFIKVQRSWIDYRDINVELYTSISKQKDKKFWENYITSQRIKDYNLLEDTINIFN
ncbi:lysozyme inhibitor LprI family protein, partial [Poseidonibacter ostreae]